MRATAFLLAATLTCAAEVQAQTDSPLFARWRWAPPTVGSRAAGMGGAFLPIADDARAAVANPAGLTQIPLTELAVAAGPLWTSAATGRRRLRVAAYFTRVEEDPSRPRDPVVSIGLQPEYHEVGLAAGFTLSRGVRIGAALAHNTLGVREEGRAETGSSEPPDPLVDTEAGFTRVTFGVLVELLRSRFAPTSALRLGLNVQPGGNWTFHPRGEPVDIRRPTVVSAGIGWHASYSWTFVAQADYLHYQEVVEALQDNVGPVASAGFSLPNTVEPRVGAEFAQPLRCGCATFKLRAGVHYQSPGRLRYGGPDPVRALLYGGQRWNTVVTLGGSLFAEHFGHALRLDVDSLDLLEGPSISVGLVWRF